MTKPRMKLLMGIVGVVTAVALVGGGTMAWFTDKKDVAPSTFTAGTVKIQAGQSVVKDTGSSGKIYYEDVTPLGVSYVNRGTHRDGTTPLPLPSKSNRNDPDKVLTKADAKDESEIFSLGYNGSIIVQLSKALLKGDVLVVEGTWGGSKIDYVETADVFVSADGTDWEPAGTVSNQTYPDGDFHDSMVAIPIENAEYVELKDTTKPMLSKNKLNDSEDGFDIDYICGRNIIDEANWNPGDTNKLAFYVNNSGTKDIDVRVKLTGEWGTETKDSEGKVNWTPSKLSTKVVNLTDINWRDGDDGYYYYNGYLKGTMGGETPGPAPTSAGLTLKATLKGNETGNRYQGMTYRITPTFQAIQHSHKGGWEWKDFKTYK